MKKIFCGLCTALITPFKNDEIDFVAFEKLVKFQIEGGVDAILFLGTTGEPSTMTFLEKQRIIKFALDTVKKDVHLVFGIGGNNPSEIIKLGQFVKAISTGRKVSVMVTAPYYNKSTQAGAVEFFNNIANVVELPMIVYNVPGRTGMNIEPVTLEKIAKNKYVWAIKEASGNMEQISQVVRLCSNISVFCGDDSLALPSYAVGCAGVISVASNVVPKDVKSIWNAYMKSENAVAREKFIEQLPLYKSLFCEVNPIPVKFAASKLGLCENEIRLPLTPLDTKFHHLFNSFQK